MKLHPAIFLLLLPLLFTGCKTTDPIVGVEGQYSCEGANPFWKLDITKDEISFLLLDQEKEIFPYEVPVETDNRKLIVTSRETAEGKVWLKISIEESACYTSTVGKKFPYKVELDRDGKVYYGCGE